MSTADQKKDSFRVEIRRKKLNEKRSIMRSQLLGLQQTSTHELHSAAQLIKQITPNNYKEHLAKLKVLSLEEAVAKELLSIVNIICQFVVKNAEDQQCFLDSMTILINITTVAQYFISKEFLIQILKNMLIPKRTWLIEWFLANLLFIKNQQAYALNTFLVESDVLEFIEQNLSKGLKQRDHIIIMNYFSCGLLATCDNMKHKQYLTLLKIFGQLQSHGYEETDWFCLMFLDYHAQAISKFNYQLFSTQFFKKLQQYCRLKKSKLIKPYLVFLIKFITQDQSPQTYERILKYNIMKSLDFCLDNRSPQIKQHCAEIATLLVTKYYTVINFERDTFFNFLALQFKNIQKMSIDCQRSFLLYMQALMQLSLQTQSTKQLMEILQKLQIMLLLSNVLKNNFQNNILTILSILHLLFNIDVKFTKQCKDYGILEYLQNYNTHNNQLKQKIGKFLDGFH